MKKRQIPAADQSESTRTELDFSISSITDIELPGITDIELPDFTDIETQLDNFTIDDEVIKEQLDDEVFREQLDSLDLDSLDAFDLEWTEEDYKLLDRLDFEFMEWLNAPTSPNGDNSSSGDSITTRPSTRKTPQTKKTHTKPYTQGGAKAKTRTHTGAQRDK